MWWSSNSGVSPKSWTAWSSPGFSTPSPLDLIDDIHQHDGVSSRVAWLDLEQQFLNNRESRAMLLNTELCAI
jgi:hypothetical protein